MLLGPSVTRRLISDFARKGATPNGAVASLTVCEREVLLLLARGLSNKEIADHLVIGLETVKSRVAKILRKLSLRDRLQAVVFAFEHGLAPW